MSAPAGSPDYDPDTWKLGYQTRQFGVASDALPGNASVTSDVPGDGPYPSVYSALANPPDAMTSGVEQDIDVTQTTGVSTAVNVSPTQ